MGNYFKCDLKICYGHVCPSVTSECLIQMTEWIKMVFGADVAFNQSYTVL